MTAGGGANWPCWSTALGLDRLESRRCSRSWSNVQTTLMETSSKAASLLGATTCLPAGLLTRLPARLQCAPHGPAANQRNRRARLARPHTLSSGAHWACLTRGAQCARNASPLALCLRFWLPRVSPPAARLWRRPRPDRGSSSPPLALTEGAHSPATPPPPIAFTPALRRRRTAQREPEGAQFGKRSRALRRDKGAPSAPNYCPRQAFLGGVATGERARDCVALFAGKRAIREPQTCTQSSPKCRPPVGPSSRLEVLAQTVASSATVCTRTPPSGPAREDRRAPILRASVAGRSGKLLSPSSPLRSLGGHSRAPLGHKMELGTS